MIGWTLCISISALWSLFRKSPVFRCMGPSPSLPFSPSAFYSAIFLILLQRYSPLVMVTTLTSAWVHHSIAVAENEDSKGRVTGWGKRVEVRLGGGDVPSATSLSQWDSQNSFQHLHQEVESEHLELKAASDLGWRGKRKGYVDSPHSWPQLQLWQSSHPLTVLAYLPILIPHL